MVRRQTINFGLVALVFIGLCVSLWSVSRLQHRRSLREHQATEDIAVEEVIEDIVAPTDSILTPEMASLQLVKSTISAHKVAVFSKSYCPYCAKAKAALSTLLKPESFFVVELDQRSDGDSIQDALLEVTGGRSVPRVFVNGEFIGGGDDTARKAQNGELKQLLIESGVEVA